MLGACSPAAREPAPQVPAAQPPAAQPPAAKSLSPEPARVISVLALNDLHGRITALPLFAGYVENLRALRRKSGGAVLVVDAGDMFQGSLESNLTEGKSVLAAYRVLGMQAVALGNHEFDFGPAGDAATGDPQGALKARVAEAGFPVLSANLIERASGQRPNWSGLSGRTMLTISGVKLGIVGALTHETPSIVMPRFFAGLDVAPIAPALAEEARALRADGAEIVLAVVHAGAKCEKFDHPHDLSSCKGNREIFDVVEALPPGSIDAVVAGHTHAGVAHVVGNVPIVEAYSRGRAFSRLDLRFRREDKSVQASVFPPHDLCPDLTTMECAAGNYEGQPVRADEKVSAAIAPALELANSQRSQLLGPELAAPVTRAADAESPLGNLFADLTLAAVKGADAAILNGGTLRADLPRGPLTYGALYEAMPFDNRLAKVKLSAADLTRVLAAHFSRDEHGIVSISGLTVRARCEKGALSLELVGKNGRRLPPTQMLTIATSDYLATGGDRLFEPANLSEDRIDPDLGQDLREAWVSGLRLRKGVDSQALYDPKTPRLRLPSSRPVSCK
ncbi:MAG TPA: bifunctional UDP-sugar hydrolase/5'-nucleotidase [Polyangiaceae bacterium]|nr:bifunctional UDP-sugar hydrolase/5'-nucleotidase [Polyangiaceae bacterium]